MQAGLYEGATAAEVGATQFGASVFPGAVAGGIQSGSVEGAFVGAFSGALFFGAGEIGNAYGAEARTAAHGVAGCIQTAAGSGRCGNGFVSAAFAQYAGSKAPDFGVVGNTITHAVLGGTASIIGGGKFENGAISGAFGYLFNCTLHPGSCTRAEIKAQAQGCRSGDMQCYRDVTTNAEEAGVLKGPSMGPVLGDLMQYNADVVLASIGVERLGLLG